MNLFDFLKHSEKFQIYLKLHNYPHRIYIFIDLIIFLIN